MFKEKLAKEKSCIVIKIFLLMEKLVPLFAFLQELHGKDDDRVGVVNASAKPNYRNSTLIIF